MRVVFFDTADRLAHGNARRVGSLDELLARPTSSASTSTAGRGTRGCSVPTSSP